MKVTKEIKAKLERISRELETELVRDNVVIESDDIDGEEVEVNALDDGGVVLLFQDPEWSEEVDDVESYDDLDVTLYISFSSWLSEKKQDDLKSLLRMKLEENGFIFSPQTGDGDGVRSYGASIEGERGPEVKTLVQFLDFLKTSHKLNSKTAAVNRAADVIGVTHLTVWRWLDSHPAPPEPMCLLMRLIMERGTTKNLPR